MNDDSTLDVHIFGNASGFGECIAVCLPDNSWGVVDCCASDADDPEKNGLLQFLLDRGVTELRFVALTHPHADHYIGIDHLFDAFEVKEFWRSGCLDKIHLQQILHNEKIAAKASGSLDASRAVSSLERMFRRIAELRKEKRIRIIDVSPRKPLLKTSDSSEFELEIIGLAPSGNQNEKYFDQISSKFLNGNVIDVRPTLNHNLISSAFLIKFGETRVILGGDVEAQGWSDARLEVGSDELRAHLVKASHHGSTNGYCEDLWDDFSRNGKLISIVAPFARSRLPRRDALIKISEHSSRILFTSDLPLRWLSEPSIPTFEFDSIQKSRWMLMRKFNVTESSRGEMRSGFGGCSLHFNRDGVCVFEEIRFPAIEMDIDGIAEQRFHPKSN